MSKTIAKTKVKSKLPTTKNKGGRPSKKDTIDFKEVERLAELGLTDIEISYVIGINEVTLNRWKKDPKFCMSIKKGKLVADQRVVKSLYKRSLGYEYKEVTTEYVEIGEEKTPAKKTKEVTKEVAPDTTACIFWLKNRRKDQWRDKGDTNIYQDNRKFQAYEFNIKTGDEIANFLTARLKNRG